MPQTLTVYIDDDQMMTRLKEEALRQDRSVSWMVRWILEDYLQRKARQEHAEIAA